MIRLQRVRTAAIPARFRGTDRIGHERALLAARRDFIATGGTSFDYLKSSMWRDAKPQLDAESHGKCAYCEASARANAHCDVEHIRPKKTYWWLGLCYDNYLLACQICNQSHKGDRYPVAAALAGPAITAALTVAQLHALSDTLAPDPVGDDAQLTLAAFTAALAAEDPDLINPYHDDPEPSFVWIADDVLAEVEVRPAAAAGRTHDRALSTIDILGLNREELRRLRYQTYRALNALCLALGAGLPAALHGQIEQAVRSALADQEAFAAMTRYLVRQIHGLTL